MNELKTPLDGADQGRRVQETALWLLITVIILAVAPLIALCQVIAFWRVDVVDDQMFAYFGWRIAHDATVYLDVWDNKPPAIYWINAVAMLIGNDTYYGVIAVCVAALLVAHLAFFVVCTSVYHREASTLTTILLGFWLTHGFYTGGTNRTETFLVACELVGMAFYMRGWARDRWWKWYLAGVFCGLAFLFKQVGLAAWGCMGLHLIILVFTRELDWRDALRRCLLLLGGCVTTVGLAAAYLASNGALEAALFATFGFNQAYFSIGRTRFPYSLMNLHLLRVHVYPILLLPLLMALATAIHAFLWWLRPLYRPPEIAQKLAVTRPVCPRYVLLFVMWFLVAFYGALLSPHGFRHYLVPVIPPLMLLAGYLVNVLQAEATLLQRIQQRAWVLVGFIIMAYFAWDAGTRQWEEFSKVWVSRIDPYLYDEARYEPARWEEVGNLVASLTTPDQKIQCLGYMPGVYLQAKRINACRFTTTEKIGHVKTHAQFVARELEATLKADPPALIVMPAEDWFKLQGRSDDLGWPVWSDLDGFIERNYTLVVDLPKYSTVYIFKRNDLLDAHRDVDLRSHLPTSRESN